MNKRVTVNIISYFGKPEIRENRKRFHNTQLEWCNKQFDKKDIYVVSQFYEKDEYNHDLVGNYIDADCSKYKLPTGPARNILLERFYKSDEDWAIFIDNDIILDDRNTGTISELLELDLSTFGAINVIYPASLGTGAFTKSFAEGLYKGFSLVNNFVFEQCLLRGGFLIIKNFKKHHGIELYFDDGTKLPNSGGEDNIFGVDIVTKLGLRVMQCRNLVMKELATRKNAASWAIHYDIDNKNIHQQMETAYKQNMSNLFSEYGIYTKMQSGKMQLSKKDFFNRYPFTGQMLAIPKKNFMSQL
jgi:hypothetical protein